MGIGDWGLGIAIPNPQSPIPFLLITLCLLIIDSYNNKIINLT